jgi:replicative DNA helicase
VTSPLAKTPSTTNGNGAGLVPPHNIEAEESVLGSILLSDRTMHALVIEESLKPEDFYRDRHAAIYRAMRELYDLGEAVDSITVTDHLRKTGKLDEGGGAETIDMLAASPPNVANLRNYARIVVDAALLRRLLAATYEIQTSVFDQREPAREVFERAEKAVLEVARGDRSQDFRKIEDILHDELNKLHKLSIEGTALIGTPSGFTDLDDITGGFQADNLVVIAGRPSMGKSALVANIAENAALDHGKPVALFSLEMSEAELAQRFVASQARIKGDELRKGRVAEDRWPKILKASQRLAAAPLWIDDSSDIGLLEIRAKTRRLHSQHPDGLGLVIIDYLQLLRADGRTDNRAEQIGQMSRGLKLLARELKVPVIALSQLNRGVEQRTDKRPLLSDLRECVTGETRVALADGTHVPIEALVGSQPEVIAVDSNDRLVLAAADRVWEVGRRRVFEVTTASGRRITATGDHRLRTGSGWKRLRDMSVGERLAVARRLPEPVLSNRWPDDHVVLLGQLIGDGSYLNNAPLRYTTASEDNSQVVTSAATDSFGAIVRRYGGASHFRFAPSRRLLSDYAAKLDDPRLAQVASSDLFWDTVVSIEDRGEQVVYDLTVPGPACWLANGGVVSHNSGAVEQDSDVVIFIYRDEYYNDDSERAGEADLIIAKHRNGAIGTVTLTFQPEYPRFMNYAREERFAG